jgi:hypothetical protein
MDEGVVTKTSFPSLAKPSNAMTSVKTSLENKIDSFLLSTSEDKNTKPVPAPTPLVAPAASKEFSQRKTMNVDTQHRVPHIMVPFTAGKAEKKVIGRGPECDVVVESGDVSRKHCELTFSGKALSVKDLNSSNGTFINGKLIAESSAASHDILRLGSIPFILVID